MEPVDPRIGKVLQGRYRVVERLAAGGMGIVYRGERLQLGRTVAIKFLHAWASSSPDALRRFEIEAQAMSRLQSAACVSVIDFGTEAGAPYLVMEFVSGDTLRDVLERGPMPRRQALSIMRQVLSGLAHAHGHGIVHRDIKPENIVLTELAGFDVHARILDFGVAKLRDSSSQLTAGMAVGTPMYMAPEQSSGQAIDARTDLYAAGVVLVEMLTGRRLFPGSGLALIRAHCEDAPPRLADLAPEQPFSAALEQVVARALAKQPAARFASAAEMAAALDETPEAAERGSSIPPGAVNTPSASVASAPALAAAPPALAARAAAPASRARRGLVLGLAAGAVVLGLVIVLATRGGGGSQGGAATGAADGALPAASLVVDAGARAPGAPSSPELAALAELGRRDPFAATSRLKKLRAARPDDPEIPYLLGNIYCAREMWPDCFEAYAAALPRYRDDAVLTRNLIRSFNSDRQHARGMAFVERELGAAALAELDATANDPRVAGHIRRRAAEVADRVRGP
ncbi:MAG: serine/threonine protein kinase [Deltaproteobacteria bacterium]|nr:serine/threonine protein kinase [Deltaproteobacteria bacterium]